MGDTSASQTLMETECRPNIIKYPRPKSDKQVKRTKSIEMKKTDKVKPKSSSGYTTTYVPDTNLTLACLVCICFNLPLGAIAMYLSLSAARLYRDGEHKKGERMAKGSVLLSLFSIVTTVLIVMSYVLWVVIDTQEQRAHGRPGS